MKTARMNMARKLSATKMLPFFPPLVIDPHWVPEEMKEKMDLIISPVSSDDRSTTCYFKVDLHRITVSAFGLVACVVRLFLASS